MTDSDQLDRVARAMTEFDQAWTTEQLRKDRGGYMQAMARAAISAMSPPPEPPKPSEESDATLVGKQGNVSVLTNGDGATLWLPIDNARVRVNLTDAEMETLGDFIQSYLDGKQSRRPPQPSEGAMRRAGEFFRVQGLHSSNDFVALAAAFDRVAEDERKACAGIACDPMVSDMSMSKTESWVAGSIAGRAWMAHRILARTGCPKES